MDNEFELLPEVFVRAPFYSFSRYDLDRLPEILQDKYFLNALWLASPEFYGVLETKKFEFESLTARERHSVAKYYNRMSFRPTPFGAFASFSTVFWSNDQVLRLRNEHSTLLHVKPDQAWLAAIKKNHPLQEEQTLLRLNPTVYRVGKHFRYYVATTDEKGKYQYAIDGIAAEKFYVDLVHLLSKSPVKAPDLLLWIAGFLGGDAEEARDYLRFLISSQLCYTNELGQMIETESPLNTYSLKNAGIDKLITNVRQSWMKGLLLKEQLAPDFTDLQDTNSGKAMFYTALQRTIDNSGANAGDQPTLCKALTYLKALSHRSANSSLSRFKTAFEKKYGNRKVPLLEALDPDTGILYEARTSGGVGEAILNGIQFPVSKSQGKQLEWSPVHRLLLAAWHQAGRPDHSPISIREEDIIEIANRDLIPVLPNSLSVMYRKTAEYLIIEQAGGVSANTLVGRFSLFDDATWQLCRKIAALEQEANPNVIFADIDQFSHTHVDNINRRRMIYPYIITLNVYPRQDGHSLIKPDELLLSVNNGELTLESKKEKKRVVPRLATAFNYRHNDMPVFRFLCDLQYQGLQAGLNFDPEYYFPGLDYYPRVMVDDIILSLAKWLISSDKVQASVFKDDLPVMDKIRLFRKNYKLPRRVSLGYTDQQLVFDLAIPSEADFFMQCINGLKKFKLTEYLLPDRSLKNGHDPYAAQFIVFLSHKQKIYKEIPMVNSQKQSPVARSFLPGSEWLYIKLFCTPEMADELLIIIIHPLTKKFAAQLERWFFIRYNEDGHHIRLRLKGSNDVLAKLLAAIQHRLIRHRLGSVLHQFEISIYDREIERYGADFIEIAENIFHEGSRLVLWFLSQKSDFGLAVFDFGLITAWKMIMTAYEGDLNHCLQFAAIMRDRFLLEFKADKKMRISLDQKYRTLKTDLTSMLEDVLTGGRNDVLVKKLNLFAREMQGFRTNQSSRSPEKNDQLLGDLVHMQLNRTFNEMPRQQELLVYYCLHEYWLSVKARSHKY
ncbi:lantibiotic dehydratase [Mucilaginibacter gynuensis]|uniref:Lantibiotic dehydratase n=2 Tax=Mucilaginibacter gynuensis TaxID=1302236 RepID=A0ABP8GL18_9SPHI